jgi:type II secretory ATPase GspE/PulE/Tfp pilus assembly ATPase PilB-like protein
LKTQDNYDPREERRRLQHVSSEQRDVDPAGWLEQTMLDALKMDASDLHIVVDGETKDLRARIRVDGQMQDFDYVTGVPAKVIMGRLKAATKLSSGGSFAPEETIYSIDLDGESRKARAVLFRVEDGGEALVMRLPLTGNLRQLDELAFSDQNLQHVLDLLAMPYKLIMIAGPMGSGKTTTAHGALLHVADPTRTVWTIEDPVERRLPNLVQLEIDEENGAGFDVLLSKLLRADYNTLFLGEIRDNATASAAVRQAKAGRQVMSTIHADDNIKSLMRLIELAGDSPMSVLSAVGGVISQRLVRKLNPEWDGVDMTKKYKGRVPIHEILFVNDSIVEVMMQDRPLSEIKQQVRAAKGSTFYDDAVRLINAGVTDREEVVKVIGEFDAEDR